MSQLLTVKTQSTQHDFLLSNLQKLMRKAGLNEAALARQTRIPQATLHKILSGKTEDPRASTLKILSDFFNLSIDALMFSNTDVQATSTSVAPVQSVPLISWKECINLKLTLHDLNTRNWEKWAVSDFYSAHGYALSSKPSMEPRFPKNTILFIDPDALPQDGDFVVVHYPATHEATLRELSIDGPVHLLLPINDHSEPTRWDDNIKLLGVLVRSSFQYL